MILRSYELGISNIAIGGFNLGLSNVISSQWALSPVLYKNKYREFSLHIAGKGNPSCISGISLFSFLICFNSSFLIPAAFVAFCAATAWAALLAAFSAGRALRVITPPFISPPFISPPFISPPFISPAPTWRVKMCKFNVLHNSIIAWLSPQYSELNINFLISSVVFWPWNGSNFFVSVLGLFTVRILFANNRLVVSYTKSTIVL